MSESLNLIIYFVKWLMTMVFFSLKTNKQKNKILARQRREKKVRSLRLDWNSLGGLKQKKGALSLCGDCFGNERVKENIK